MPAPTVVIPQTGDSKKRVLRVLLLVLLVAVVILAAGITFWFYHAAHESLPQLDGILAASDLKAPVQVIRDEHGVPHITAANIKDLFWAQGFVTAQDRLWQMDLSRRYGAGEMSEI